MISSAPAGLWILGTSAPTVETVGYCRSSLRDLLWTALVGGINVGDGKLTCAAVAEAHGLVYSAPTF